MWQVATVVDVRDETARAKTFRLALPESSHHAAGQHYVVRLTAPDGYTASRSYSIASAPDGGNEIELTVERLREGEVSTYLHEVVEPGDELEVRGPIGGWFVWDGTTRAVLVGGGSGVVPLMAMLRHARNTGRTDLLRLIVSVRSPRDLYYADELPGPESSVVYTREAPDGWPRPVGRLTARDVAGALLPDALMPDVLMPNVLLPDVTAYVCGSARFADAATDLLVATGVPTGRIRVERFGPSG